MLGRRALLEPAPAALAAPVVTGRAAHGAAPVETAGTGGARGGFDDHGRPATACLDPNGAGGSPGRPARRIDDDAQGRLPGSTPGSQDERQRGTAR